MLQIIKSDRFSGEESNVKTKLQYALTLLTSGDFLRVENICSTNVEKNNRLELFLLFATYKFKSYEECGSNLTKLSTADRERAISLLRNAKQPLEVEEVYILGYLLYQFKSKEDRLDGLNKMFEAAGSGWTPAIDYLLGYCEDYFSRYPITYDSFLGVIVNGSTKAAQAGSLLQDAGDSLVSALKVIGKSNLPDNLRAKFYEGMFCYIYNEFADGIDPQDMIVKLAQDCFEPAYYLAGLLLFKQTDGEGYMFLYLAQKNPKYRSNVDVIFNNDLKYTNDFAGKVKEAAKHHESLCASRLLSVSVKP